MNFEEFNAKGLYFDIKSFKLDSLRFGENAHKTALKFLRVISEMDEKSVKYLCQTSNGTLRFLDSEYNYVTIQVDAEYKKKLLWSNVFKLTTVDSEKGRLFPRTFLERIYIKILSTNTPLKSVYLDIPAFGNLRMMGISNTKTSSLNQQVAKYGIKELLHCSKMRLTSYYVYISGGWFANSFVFYSEKSDAKPINFSGVANLRGLFLASEILTH